MKESSIKPTVKSDADILLCGLAIGFGCLVTLLWWYTRTSLWEDEIIAITHANQPLPLFFIEMLRSDIHPPLYFLQLKFWHDIGMKSDSAVLLNSVVCAFLSLATMFIIAKKAYNKKAAWYATALFALFPIFSYGGGNLRMYGLVPACVLLVWYSNRNWFLLRQRKWLIWTIAFEGITSYLHAIEFFIVGFIALAACLESLYNRRKAPTLQGVGHDTGVRNWIIAQCIVLLLIAPLMASGIIRGSEAGAPSSFLEMLTEPGALIAGWAAASIVWVRIAGFLIFLFLAAAAMLESRSRILTLVAVVATLTVAITVSLLAKPMIKVPVFAASLLPFLALGAGVGIASHPGRFWRVGGFVCMGVLALAALPLMRYQMTSDNYGETGRLVKKLAKPGDIVVMPNVSVYWGIMRYAVGENWGEPLAILPLQANDQWNKIFRKLGPETTLMLGLRPVSDHVISNRVTYVVGEDARQMTTNATRVLVVQRNGYKTDVQLGARFARQSIIRPDAKDIPEPDALAISLFIRNDDGESVAKHPLTPAVQ